ncbi:MAG: HDOD domain-containing protein [Bryobacter sp.]|nr:HDOD domain-containing protein [Bryobacter sp.]
MEDLSPENRMLLYKQKVQRMLNSLPPFSPILNRLIASLASDDVRFSDLSTLIEKDTVLSGHVLRLVNSAAMARRSRINSIAHAVSVLGIVRLRNFLLSISIARLWQNTRTVPPWNMAAFNLHGAAVAQVSDLVAQHAHCQYPEGAFLAGLLHDYGKLLIASALPQEFTAIMKEVSQNGVPLLEAERQVIGLTHPELSALTLKTWNLPDEIVRAVEYHHDPDLEESSVLEVKPGFLLSRVVFMADQVVHQLGIHTFAHEGTAPSSESADEAIPDAGKANAQATLEMLGLRENAAKIVEDFETEFEAIRSFF